jgi:prepilin-type N-terminal cleavage/methylation domain-containing protein
LGRNLTDKAKSEAIMKQKNRNKSHGFTLIECMVVMLVLMVTFSGIMSFRYFSVLSAERAETELLAARAAVVLSEAWRAQKGADDFDPIHQSFDDHFLIQSGSVSAFAGASEPGYIHLGNYQIQIESACRTGLAGWKAVRAGIPSVNLNPDIVKQARLL